MNTTRNLARRQFYTYKNHAKGILFKFNIFHSRDVKFCTFTIYGGASVNNLCFGFQDSKIAPTRIEWNHKIFHKKCKWKVGWYLPVARPCF